MEFEGELEGSDRVESTNEAELRLENAAVSGAKAGPSWDEAHDAFREFVLHPAFPCVGARAAFHSESYVLGIYNELATEGSTARLARDLGEFVESDLIRDSEYATFVAIFRGPLSDDEVQFENRLWQQLSGLNRIDAGSNAWNTDVQSDPGDPRFSFSFGGCALYVIGMHPGSSREARRFKLPTLVFNPHEQFERLRVDGKCKRMQQTIRQRDLQLHGSVNPMLSDFGEVTEARQYSGRVVESNWRAPFEAANPPPKGKCPFH